jgi:hypothetical protein
MPNGESLPVPVTADAQFGVVRVLRPFTGFEAVYTGQSADIPLMFTEGGQALDKFAEEGRPGYDPHLLAGLTVPVGARALLWIPNLTYDTGAGDAPYTWSFWWRYRSLADYLIDNQRTYHIARTATGVADTSSGVAQPRFVIPAANQSVVYVQSEPAAALTRAVQNARAEDINFGSSNLPLPLLPDGSTGVMQQGVYNPALVTDANQPGFELHEFSGTGDELLIGISRSTGAVANWTFDGADILITRLVGSNSARDVGVYAAIGTAP